MTSLIVRTKCSKAHRIWAYLARRQGVEILQILAHLTGLPHEAVVKDFLKTAEEMGLKPEDLTLDEIRNVLQKKLDQTLPAVIQQLDNDLAH